MKKTIILATSIAALSGCGQMNSGNTTVDPASTQKPEGEGGLGGLVNPFMPNPNAVEPTVSQQNTPETNFVESELVAAMDQETNDQETARENTADDRKGWVVYSTEPLDDNAHITIVGTHHYQLPDDVSAIPQPSDDATVEPIQKPDIELSIPFVEVASGQFSAIAQQRLVIVRDQTALDSLWIEHTQNMSAPDSQPVVDFNQDMLIGVFRGNTANCTETIKVTRIAENQTLDVRVELNVGDVDAQCLLPEQDFVFVATAQSDKFVNLQTQLVEGDPPMPLGVSIEDRLELLRERLVEAIGDASCNDVSQCLTVAMGAKACGGPTGYLAYSTAKSNSDYVAQIAGLHRYWSQAYNRIHQVISDCTYTFEPPVMCEASRCVMSENPNMHSDVR